jgi:hypothetical protein
LNVARNCVAGNAGQFPARAGDKPLNSNRQDVLLVHVPLDFSDLLVDEMTYRESEAFRASRAKTARKRYWRDPKKARQRSRDYRNKQKCRCNQRK